MSNQPADSRMNTVIVPPQGEDPAVLYAAAARVLRVVVRNAGANTIFLSHDASNLQTVQLAGTFQLPPGGETTIVLMPRQSLVASGAGPTGLASIAVSEAIPIAWAES